MVALEGLSTGTLRIYLLKYIKTLHYHSYLLGQMFEEILRRLYIYMNICRFNLIHLKTTNPFKTNSFHNVICLVSFGSYVVNE